MIAGENCDETSSPPHDSFFPMDEFFVPIHYEDLEFSREDRWTVQEVRNVDSMGESEQLSVLQGVLTLTSWLRSGCSVVPTVGNAIDGEDVIHAEAEEKIATSSRMIVNEDCFDLFYSICRCVCPPREASPHVHRLPALSTPLFAVHFPPFGRAWNNMVKPARERLIDTLASSVSALAETATADTVPDRVGRNAFKMYIFLLAHVLHEAEQEIQHAEDVGRITTKKRSTKVRPSTRNHTASHSHPPFALLAIIRFLHIAQKSAKDRQSGAKNSGDDTAHLHVWESLRPRVVVALERVIRSGWTHWWPGGAPEEEFLSLIVRLCTDLIGSAPAMRSKPVRKPTLEVLACITERFPAVLPSTVATVMALLSSKEHVPSVLAELLGSIPPAQGPIGLRTHPIGGGPEDDEEPKENDGDDKKAASKPQRHHGRLGPELLREVSRVNSKDVRDTGGLKHVGTFLSELANRAPSLLLSHMSLLLPHLDSDAPPLRSSLVSVMATLIKGSCSGEAEHEGKTRLTLLDLLHERVWDSNAFTRAAVVRAWCDLVESGCLPHDRLHQVVDIAAERMKDKGALVRRAALQLLVCLMEHNPFAASLDPAPFRVALRDTEDWLVERGPVDVRRELRMAMAKRKNEDDGSHGKVEEEAEEQQDIEEEEVTPEQAEKMQFLRYCSAALHFTEQMQAMLPVLRQLLGSRTATDVTEAIRGLRCAREFGIPGAESALLHMLPLVWSGEASVKEHVLSTFRELYLDVDAESERSKPAIRLQRHGALHGADTKQAGEDDDTDEENEEETEGAASMGAAAERVAMGLVRLVDGASTARHTCMEEILAELGRRDAIPVVVLRKLWDFAVHGARLTVRDATASHETNSAEDDDGAGKEFVGDDANNAADNGAQGQRAATVVLRSLRAARGATCVLAMAARSLPHVVDGPGALARLGMILTALSKASQMRMQRGERASPDFAWARFVCLALQRYRAENGAQPGQPTAAARALPPTERGGVLDDARGWGGEGEARENWEEARHRAVAATVRQLRSMLLGHWDAAEEDSPHFFSAAEAAVDALFVLCPHPDQECSALLQTLTRQVWLHPSDDDEDQENEERDGTMSKEAETDSRLGRLRDSVSRVKLARWVFLVGHAAVRTLVHMESLLGTLKMSRSKLSEVEERLANAGIPLPAGFTAMMHDDDDGNHEDDERHGMGNDDEDVAVQLGQEGRTHPSGTAIEDPDEWLHVIAEHELAHQHFLGHWGPMVAQIVMHEQGLLGNEGVDGDTATAGGVPGSQGGGDTLGKSAVLALCKLMTISSSFCESHLRLLFTVLQRASSPALRATIAISLGDLAVRHPNQVEPWTGHLYARLRDPDTRVRRNTLMVLTHLILNDMIKVKGQVAEIAVCLVDKDRRVSDLAHLFFTELAKRGTNSPIYNLLPDALSCLSSHPLVDATAFRKIMRFLISFIQREKHGEVLTEKLAHRFHTSDDPRLWKDLSFCLANLPHNERSIRRLNDHFRSYKQALGEEVVFKHFETIVGKARKAVVSKPDMKEAVEEWWRLVEETHKGRSGDQDVVAAATKASARARKMPQRRRRRPATEVSELEFEDDDEEEVQEEGDEEE